MRGGGLNPISGYAECVRPPGAPVEPPPPRPAVVKLAVFDFEMEDVSPAASLLGQSTNDQAIMEKVSSEARRMLERSGRFILVDVSKIDAEAGQGRSRCETATGARPASRRRWAPNRRSSEW